MLYVMCIIMVIQRPPKPIWQLEYQRLLLNFEIWCPCDVLPLRGN